MSTTTLVSRALRAAAHRPAAEGRVILTDLATVLAATSRDRARLRLARRHEALRKPVERGMTAKLLKLIRGARREVLKNIASQGVAPIRAAEGRSGAAADLNFKLEAFVAEMKAVMRQAILDAVLQAGAEMFEELGREDDVFSMAPRAVLTFLGQRENLIADAAQEIHEKIGVTLGAGYEAGDSMPQLAARVGTAFTGIGRDRATTIAATETAVAYGVARHDAMEQAGIQYKEWLTAADDHVRATHAELEGEVVALHENFSNGLAFPGDPAGPPAQVIRCRCIQIAVAPPK